MAKKANVSNNLNSQEVGLVKKSDQLLLAERISRGELTTADEIAEAYGVSFQQVISLLANANFIALVSAVTKASATMAWHSKVMPKIVQMLDHPDPKIQLQAMKMLGQITDSLKGGDFNVVINLENMVKQFSEPDEKTKASNNLKDAAVEAEFRRVIEEED